MHLLGHVLINHLLHGSFELLPSESDDFLPLLIHYDASILYVILFILLLNVSRLVMVLLR